MPVISMFYGVIVSMFSLDTKKHKAPHIHVAYQGKEAVIAIPSGEVLDGDLKAGKLKLVQAWVEIHNEELIADWELAVKGQQVFKIEPLR